MNNLDNKENLINLQISIWDLNFIEEEFKPMVQAIGRERLQTFLTKYYFYKVSQSLNTRTYESIEKLESIQDLIRDLE